MGLQKYQQKRKFKETPEPEGTKKSAKGSLVFVVQKHQASQLHYDFRLEMEGVLKSWAVPKGPVLDPAIKRMAMMVEDHPFEYRKFHGRIPKGNYGAGTVEIWDEGTYESLDGGLKKEQERALLKGLRDGHITFILHGKKLKGEFALVKMKNVKQKNAWLLIKAAKKVELTNLDKVFWPQEEYTKGDVVQYYRDISKIILPYLEDRPESLHRHPDGIAGESFYQKDVDHQPPSWVNTSAIYAPSARKKVHYIICNDQDTLLYMANLGCIELNPWNSRLRKLDNPDFVIIDLDPEGIGFEVVIEAAQVIHEILEKAGIANYCKTSGASGLHICIPLGAKYSYDQARRLTKVIVTKAHERLPKTTSLERSPAKRRRKVYLDWLQNSRGQTLASAYCLRPQPGAPISTPLEWNEVKPGLDPKAFNIKTIFPRLKKKGDLWEPVLGRGIDLKRALEQLGNK